MKMALKRLEPCAGKLARTVLRRAVTGNSHGLSDAIFGFRRNGEGRPTFLRYFLACPTIVSVIYRISNFASQRIKFLVKFNFGVLYNGWRVFRHGKMFSVV